MREHVNDPYVKLARQHGYRSRAAFKLDEINTRDRLIRAGMLVVDLGATPGGWSQIAAKLGAKVVALDLLEMDAIAGVTFIQGDFTGVAALTELEQVLAGRLPDLVISDMAPNMSGVASADQARSMHLCELALEFACNHLKPGGDFLVKAFQGEGFQEYVKAMRDQFAQVVTRKPRASRDRSSEVYVLGKSRRQTVAAAPESV
ncbi:ribosomal RNA large subunit methyltransferase E [Sulfuriferula plumbiphila]|uniref:Ribosomal RNA large subunit methyltransferase E n=2 Tax=Sulfuriferula plumbiphila TaxID=171865 RepID=A0A512L7Q0_9PROT|nr:ribosomal RNA large subunit methyltransferase E [Sulfuriferula plumbiphila]GEP30513.1 ribosomal RNA large subunit methyltransferase E [Sulfuriferula plumbiphila]